MKRLFGVLPRPFKLESGDFVRKSMDNRNELPRSTSTLGPSGTTGFEDSIVLTESIERVYSETNVCFVGVLGIAGTEKIAMEMR